MMNLSHKDNQLTDNISLIDPFYDERWDKFVEAHPFGWIHHLSGWKKVLENSFDHMKGYYLVHLNRSSRKIEYALPMFYVKSLLLGDRMVSIPFATLCDPLVANKNEYKLLLDAALKMHYKLKCKYIEIKGFASTPIINDDRTVNLNHFINHYLQIDTSPELILKVFHRSCVRQKIHRALNNDIKIIVGKDENDLKIFYKVYLKTRKRVARPVQPYRFFHEIWKTFHPLRKVDLLLAENDNFIIGAVILFKYKDRVSVEFAASDEKYLYLFPNHFLFWKSIQLAYREGFKIFDFGRTHNSNIGLCNFKKRWGTKVANISEFYYPARAAINARRSESSWKFNIMSKICKRAPNFINQAVGRLCYRHLG